MKDNYLKEVNKYISNAPISQQKILSKLREIIHKASLDIEEKIRWSHPHFDYMGKGMCFIQALKERVTFGFWFGDKIYNSPKLSKEAKAIYETMGNLTDVSQIPSTKLIIEEIHLAMKLIESGNRDVKEKKVKPQLVIPDYLSLRFKKDKTANSSFSKMSPSHQREYVDWIIDAKTDETRENRISTMMSQVKEGKSKNWKYIK